MRRRKEATERVRSSSPEKRLGDSQAAFAPIVGALGRLRWGRNLRGALTTTARSVVFLSGTRTSG